MLISTDKCSLLTRHFRVCFLCHAEPPLLVDFRIYNPSPWKLSAVSQRQEQISSHKFSHMFWHKASTILRSLKWSVYNSRQIQNYISSCQSVIIRSITILHILRLSMIRIERLKNSLSSALEFAVRRNVSQLGLADSYFLFAIISCF